MERIEIDSKVTELETAIEKATYIVEDLFSNYGVSDIANPSEKEKNMYAYSCGRIYNYISIANDYILESRQLIKELRELI